MAALCVLLGAACGYDYRDKRIPNYLIVLAAVLGAGWRLKSEGLYGMLFYIGEAVLVMALLYPFFKIGTIGAGDVKLLGVAAGYLPYEKILIFLFVSLLASAVISIFKMLRRNIFHQRMVYLLQYLADVLDSRKWRLYREKGSKGQGVEVCLSGPVLLSLLLYLGGVY